MINIFVYYGGVASSVSPEPGDSRRRAGGARRDPGGARRAQILDAAARLFARHGFHGVSMDDIGTAVGMSGPGLYRHFSGKTAVLTEMLMRISERLVADGGSRAAAASDAHAALEALLRGHIEFALGQPALITVHDRELGNVPEPARRRIRRLQRLYVEEWVTVLTELFPRADQPALRAAVHAAFGLLNSTPHSAGELADAQMARLLYAMAHASLMSAAAQPTHPAQPAHPAHPAQPEGSSSRKPTFSVT